MIYRKYSKYFVIVYILREKNKYVSEVYFGNIKIPTFRQGLSKRLRLRYEELEEPYNRGDSRTNHDEFANEGYPLVCLTDKDEGCHRTDDNEEEGDESADFLEIFHSYFCLFLRDLQ